MITNRVKITLLLPGKKYPFYGVQWHPEVNRFQWNRTLHFPHSRHAVQLSSLLAEFFTNEGNQTLSTLMTNVDRIRQRKIFVSYQR